LRWHRVALVVWALALATVETETRQRAFWCVLAGLVAITLMVGGGMASLQALTISVALPFGILLLLMCAGLLKGLLLEPAQ
jgi:BCCT family betaine/carnitine transporter